MRTRKATLDHLLREPGDVGNRPGELVKRGEPPVSLVGRPVVRLGPEDGDSMSIDLDGDRVGPDGLDHREAIDEALGRAGYPSSNTENFCSLCLTPSKSSPPSTRQPAKATPSSPAKSTIHHLERTLPSASTVSISTSRAGRQPPSAQSAPNDRLTRP